MKAVCTLLIGLACWCSVPAQAELKVKTSAPKLTGQKAILSLTMKNAFSEKVESARAAVFLSDQDGKVIGQATHWVIGGSKDRPALEPDKESSFHFVVPLNKTASTNLQARVLFTRLLLSGGRSVDATKEVTLEASGK